MKHAPVVASILEECAACGEIAFDGRRCSECFSVSLDSLHDKIRRDIQGVKTLGEKRSQVWR